MARVVIAMSGGVDSSVAAALLVKQGHEVIGMMMRLWGEPTSDVAFNRCCTPDALAQARRVAGQLGIPFYAIDAQSTFKKRIVDFFIDSYAAGLTPNPCLECNRHIRWSFLLDQALDLGADYLATGHYARVGGDAANGFQLLKAIDDRKDQSYVLSVMGQAQLRHALFPLGELTKPEVRELARRFSLEVADKQDSQDICFVPTGRYTDLIGRLRPNAMEPGDIVDLAGRVLGRHQGIAQFTVGQRKGLGIASGSPLYVVRLDAEHRRVVVGPREALRMDRIVLRDVNWIGDGALDRMIGAGIEMFVRVRSTRPPQPALLRAGKDGYEVELVAGEEGVSPGQACVFYAAEGSRVLGGGWITR